MRPFHHCTIVCFAGAGILAAGSLFYQLSWWVLAVWGLLYVVVLVLGSSCVQWNFYLKAHHRGNDRRYIALTFDDGPAAFTEDILDVLRAEQVPAAFFAIGSRVAARPDLVRRWESEGHLTGNHSYHHHGGFDLQSAAAMKRELEEAGNAIRKVTGRQPLLFRPPYGVTNPNLARAVRDTGVYAVGWNVRSYDTVIRDGNRLLRRILGRLKGGDVILLHDSMPVTAAILTDLIKAAREKGFIFVRVDKLLELPAYA